MMGWIEQYLYLWYTIYTAVHHTVDHSNSRGFCLRLTRGRLLGLCAIQPNVAAAWPLAALSRLLLHHGHALKNISHGSLGQRLMPRSFAGELHVDHSQLPSRSSPRTFPDTGRRLVACILRTSLKEWKVFSGSIPVVRVSRDVPAFDAPGPC